MLPHQNPADEPIGLLIGAVRRRLKQAVSSRVRGYGLSAQQFWVLVAISEHPGLSVGELAAHLRMDTPTASRLVFTLTGRQLVGVRGDAADRRRARLYLDPAGAALRHSLQEIAAAVRGAVVQDFSEADLHVLRQLLGRIVANMDHFENGGRTRLPIPPPPGRDELPAPAPSDAKRRR